MSNTDGPVSETEIKVFRALETGGEWVTGYEVAQVTGIHARTVRWHLNRMAACGIVREVQVQPAYKYRLNQYPDQDAQARIDRIVDAAEALGIR